jgi:drug/metabolite transporter (DMT)-like permease
VGTENKSDKKINRLSGKNFHRDHALGIMVGSVAAWGLGTVMSKSVLTHFPPLTLLVIQLTTSICFLWTLVGLRRKTQLSWSGLRRAIPLGLPGLLEPGLAYSFALVGLSRTTASEAALISTLEPIMVLGLAWIFLKEKLSLSLMLLAGVAIAGISLTIGLEFSFSHSSLGGNLLVAIGTFCAAIYVVLSRKNVEQLAPLPLAAIQQSIGLLGVMVIWLLWGNTNLSALANLSLATWGMAMLSGIVNYALGFWLYLMALQGIPASIAAQFLCLIPIFSVGGAYLFLGEQLTLNQGLGMLLTLSAMFFLVQGQSQEQSSHQHQ